MTTTTLQILAALVEFFAIVFKSIITSRKAKEMIAV